MRYTHSVMIGCAYPITIVLVVWVIALQALNYGREKQKEITRSTREERKVFRDILRRIRSAPLDQDIKTLWGKESRKISNLLILNYNWLLSH
jgi:hypothetical protein